MNAITDRNARPVRATLDPETGLTRYVYRDTGAQVPAGSLITPVDSLGIPLTPATRPQNSDH